jgi:hypothetical protein
MFMATWSGKQASFWRPQDKDLSGFGPVGVAVATLFIGASDKILLNFSDVSHHLKRKSIDQCEGGTRGPADSRTRGPADPRTRRLEDPQTRGPADSRTRRLEDPRTRRPEDPQTRGPADSRTRGPADPRTRRLEDPRRTWVPNSRRTEWIAGRPSPPDFPFPREPGTGRLSCLLNISAIFAVAVARQSRRPLGLLTAAPEGRRGSGLVLVGPILLLLLHSAASLVAVALSPSLLPPLDCTAQHATTANGWRNISGKRGNIRSFDRFGPRCNRQPLRKMK